VEWGPRKSVLQASLSSEAEEFAGAGLLGLAQDPDDFFVFVVTPAYRQWVGSRREDYLRGCVRFLSVAEVALEADRLTFIWPART
jgi:hypothetical protein